MGSGSEKKVPQTHQQWHHHHCCAWSDSIPRVTCN